MSNFELLNVRSFPLWKVCVRAPQFPRKIAKDFEHKNSKFPLKRGKFEHVWTCSNVKIEHKLVDIFCTFLNKYLLLNIKEIYMRIMIQNSINGFILILVCIKLKWSYEVSKLGDFYPIMNKFTLKMLFLTFGVIYDQILTTGGKISCQKKFKLKLWILRV